MNSLAASFAFRLCDVRHTHNEKLSALQQRVTPKTLHFARRRVLAGDIVAAILISIAHAVKPGLGEGGGASAMGIGLDDDSADTYIPASVMHLPANDAVQVEVGTYEHVCVLRANGDVYCAGHNEFGQLGDGTTITRTEPVRVIGLSVE